MVKAALSCGFVVLIAALGASAMYFRDRRPPDCNDPRTLALVRQTLVTQHHLPSGTTVAYIRTIAGGFLAMRFVCQSEVTGFDPHALPPGTPVPGWVRYTSQLTPDGRQLEVTVKVQPLLEWKLVQ